MRNLPLRRHRRNTENVDRKWRLADAAVQGSSRNPADQGCRRVRAHAVIGGAEISGGILERLIEPGSRIRFISGRAARARGTAAGKRKRLRKPEVQTWGGVEN